MAKLVSCWRKLETQMTFYNGVRIVKACTELRKLFWNLSFICEALDKADKL